jgi:hypothetical protein
MDKTMKFELFSKSREFLNANYVRKFLRICAIFLLFSIELDEPVFLTMLDKLVLRKQKMPQPNLAGVKDLWIESLYSNSVLINYSLVCLRMIMPQVAAMKHVVVC